MKTGTYQLINHIGAIEYILEITEDDNNTVITLTRSNDGSWSDEYKGTLIATLTDDGTDITFKFNKKKTGYKFNYDDACVIRILMNAHHYHNHMYMGQAEYTVHRIEEISDFKLF